MDNFDTDIISLEEILDIAKKYWKLVIIVSLISTIISFMLTIFFIKPQYTVYTKVFIGKEETQQHEENYNNDDVQMYLKLLKTYSEIVKTNKLVSKALDDYNLDSLSSQEVLGNLTCIPTADTQILEIKYNSSDKELASKVITAITSEFIKTAQDLIPNGTVKIVEDVIVPSAPSKPNKKLNLCIGFMLGAMMSCGVIFLREFLDNTFKSKEKLKRIIGCPVIGVIPDEANITRRSRRRHNSKYRSKRTINKLIMESASTSIVSEAYRTLQTNIKYSSKKSIQTLLVTSAQLQEGKSTVAGNLALGFSEENNNVIIIDCDLRNPSLHKKFSLPNTIGLSEIIQENKDYKAAVQKYNDNLSIITSGKCYQNPASLLASEEMNNLIKLLKQHYDLIILDSAPVLAVTDAQILSRNVDGTLIVVKYGISKVPAVVDCKNLLDMVNAPLTGTVLHGSDINKSSYYSYTPKTSYFSADNNILLNS